MGLVCVYVCVAEYLLDMYDFRTGVPGDSATEEIPLPPFLDGYLLNARERGDGHDYRTPVLKVHLELASFGERYRFYLGNYIPVSFYAHFFLLFNYTHKVSQTEEITITTNAIINPHR